MGDQMRLQQIFYRPNDLLSPNHVAHNKIQSTDSNHKKSLTGLILLDPWTNWTFYEQDTTSSNPLN